MFGLRFYLLLVAFCSCSILGRGDEAPKTELLDVPPKTVESLAASQAVQGLPETSSVEPTTVTAPTPDPDPKNTTTSTTTTTTTTTTTSTTTTTTQKPPAPTPPPKPTPPKPLPAPDQGTWSLTNKTSNVTCIVAQFAAQINITYRMTNNNVTSYRSEVMNVPVNATVQDGSCNASSTQQWLLIGWPGSDGVLNTIRLQFLKNETTRTYALSSLNLTVDASVLVNASVPADTLEFSYGEEWATPLATSYRCLPATKLSMSNETYDATAVVTVSRLQEEAFRTVNGTGFSAARECGGGDVPDAVPIAVGCALGGLVLVVLVAYLVARRRSAARGYLSM
ncbi:lysosome-associated membrane glycoprotein 1-like isoform X3 [Ostrinia furnacalis]|uniref:lysosome-associated membrane glycoprotein 1-like isoform X1 n=1 Tax=Ostrinia furnacalis TaxID=93504 RepID=UPI00103D9329|nr:lysosome-associated membrane glycoprotein 1-like isoform X1 [Ostrinia furnacalis]XP_028162585.1 lysosome-associated membrane glycoprotein 1-like isoform X1 [Ostrinia furnacalis]XP_028162587.1 lysosome-associated membrane glycoprotein 1-like isoform X2 [Ostrinia furnacalis]XP_028162588.1 lysosome-associated membrane glycoprotein 1-like isoform X3 [Ostrinia furnacalis]